MKYILFLFFLCLSNIANAQTTEKLYQDALDKGDISTLAKNGYILEKRNENEKAAELYKRAADLGDSWSMFAISNLYDAGKGVQKDFKRSFEYARKAYEHHLDGGLAEGKLGYCYEEGRGCEQNFEMAHKFYLEAASKGYNYAYARLAIMYALGKGVDRDKNKALEYIRIAKNNQKKGYQDLAYDQFCLYEGDIYCYFKEYDKAIEIWYDIIDNHLDILRNNNFLLSSKENPNGLISYACKGLYGIDNFEKIGTNNENVFILIIGNENYQDVTKVPYAIHDSYAFFLHCLFTLGFGGDKMHYCKDATLGTLRKEINWLKQSVLVSDKKAKIIIYYAGHGVPDEQSLSAYLLPVDGIVTNARTGYSLQKLYSEMSSVQADQITVLLDACFSGTKREGEPLVAARGVAIKTKEEKAQGNMVVLSAAQGDETAYPYTEKRHGLFTYYLLNKLKESKGNATLGELSDYIISNVKKTSIVNNGKLQTPTVNTSLDDSWKKLTLK